MHDSRTRSAISISGQASRLTIALAALSLAGGCVNSSESRMAAPAAEAATVESQSGSTLQFLADRMAENGDPSAAIPLYRRAHRLHPGDAGPLLGLGKALKSMGVNAEALDAFRAAHERDSGDPEILAELASMQLAMGRPDLAMPLYEDALARDPSNVSALSGKAIALDATGRQDQAQDAYKAGLAKAPDDLALRSNLGLSLAAAGKSEEAVELLEEVALNPRATVRHRQNLALAYGLAGRDDEARLVSSIDLAEPHVNQNTAYFASLRGMEPEQRTAALMSGLRAPKQDISAPGNLVYAMDDALARVSLSRVVGRADAASIPTPKPTDAVEAEPAPKKTVVLKELPPMLEDEGYAVQIAAYRKAEELIEGWNILSVRHADLLGGIEPRRSEVDFGPRDQKPNGFFYRLNAGPLTDFDKAKEICDGLNARGGECWIRVPEPKEGHPPKSLSDARDANPGAKAKLDVDALVHPKPQEPRRSTAWTQVSEGAEMGSEEGGSDDMGYDDSGDEPVE